MQYSLRQLKCFGVAITLGLMVPAAFAYKPPQPPAVQTPSQWQELKPVQGEISIQQQTLPTFPDGAWWMQFNDPYLTQYIQTALSANHTLKLAVLRINEAKQLAGVVRAQQLPFVSIGADYQRQHNSNNIIGSGQFGGQTTQSLVTSNSQPTNVLPKVSTPGATYNLITVPLEVSYEADIFGKNRLKTQSAREQIVINAQQARLTEIVLEGQVASAYLNLVRADKEIAIAQGLIDNVTQANALRTRLYQTGLTTYDTILKAEQDLASARESLTTYQQQQGIYAHQLTVLMGQDPAAPQDIKRQDLDQLNLPAQINVGVPSQILLHRPDIIASEDTLKQAHINVEEARREFFPTVDLLGEIGLGSLKISNLFNWQSRIAAMAVSVVQSLYTGGAKTATLKTYKVRVEEDLESYVQNILQSLEDVEDSLSLYKSSLSAFQDYSNQIQSSNKAAGLAQLRFTTGIGNKIDLLTAQQQVLTFQQLAAANKGDVLIDTVSLYKALGGGLTP